MKITYLKSVDSTQTYLKNLLQKQNIELPHAVSAEMQTNGLGSRNNSWEGLEGNLFLSFALPLENLPKDLKLESASIYFAYLLKETLNELNSDVWLKWPNDFYINNLKVGGMITNVVGDNLICGVGINLLKAPKNFAKLDVNISKDLLLKKYFKNIANVFSWKQIFSKYKIEFVRSQSFSIHKNNLNITLEKAILQKDGSIIINGERIYSTR